MNLALRAFLRPGLVPALVFLAAGPRPAAAGDVVARVEAAVLAPDFAAVPAREFPVADHGAKGDGVTLDTAAIQAAIDAAAAAGGGVVTLAPGTYLSGALFLKSHVELRLAAGVTLRAVPDDAHYPRLPTRVAGIEMEWPAAFLNIRDADHVRITGPGTIDGNGKVWWDKFNGRRGDYEKRGLRWAVDYDCERVRGVAAWRASDVLLEGFTVLRAGFWNVVATYCERVRIAGVRVDAFSDGVAGPSTDGIDVDSSRLVLVEDCVTDCNDDNICLKAGRDADGLRVNRPTELVVVRRCTALRGHGAITLGSETAGGIRDVEVSALTGRGTKFGIRFKSAKVRGGVVERITIRDVDFADIPAPFDFNLNWFPNYSYATIPADLPADQVPPHWRTLTAHVEPPERGLPEFRDIRIERVKVRGAKTAFAGTAYPEKPMHHFTLTDLDVEAAKAGEVKFTADWTLTNVRVHTPDGADLGHPVLGGGAKP